MKRVLQGLHDLGEYAFIAGRVTQTDLGAPPELLAWRIAADEARTAYAEWRARRDRDSYAVYRACADRADAAQASLAAR
jgi:hypothetical protein